MRAIPVLLALLACPASAEPCRYAFRAGSLRTVGATVHEGAVVPQRQYRHPGTGELWIEAERASAVARPVQPITDEAASGGTVLHIPDATYHGRDGRAVFIVECATPGTYRLWARTYWPNIGSNSFYLGLGDAEEHVFGNTEGPGQINRWFWLAAEPWKLGAGIHRITIRWREDGTQLDKIVLSTRGDFTPNGTGGSAAEPVLPGRLLITSGDCRPPRVDRWQRVEVKGAAPVHAEVSTDGGATWHAVEAGGRLDGLPARGDGTDRVRCRLAMPNPQSDTRIAGLIVHYDGAPSMRTLENDRMAVTFDVTSGTLARIVNKALEPQRPALIGSGALPFVLRHYAEARKTVEAVPPEAMRYDGFNATPSSLVLRYTATTEDGEFRIRCAVSLAKDDPTSTWTIEVANATKALELTEVEFPVLDGVRIGDDAGDDWLVWPRWGGGRHIPKPADNAPGRGVYLSGHGIMNWLDVHDADQGLYLASYDKTLLMGALVAQSSQETGRVLLATSKMPRVGPGGTFRSEPSVVSAHAGDWHWAADRYRTWIQSWMKPYNPPAWLVESDGWLGRGRGTNFLVDIPAHYRLARELGLNHVEFWGQMAVGIGAGASCCNRLYFPDPRYGSEADFAKAVRSVRRAGGHIGFYTNGQAWNPRYPDLRPEYGGLMPADALVPDWEGGFKHNALVRADGSFVPQYAKPADDPYPFPCLFHLMCAAAKGWQDYLYHYIVEKYVKQYGVDHMYVDQLGAAVGQPCYARGHGHDDCIGAWGRGNVEKFRRFKEDGRRIEPQFSLSTEGFGDAYGQYVDAFLLSPSSTGVWPYSAPEIVRYTFPRYVCLDGFANGNAGGGPYEDVVYRVYLLGNRFDLFPRPELAAFYKKVIRLRQETGELLYRGTFRDAIGLTVSDPKVRAKLWRLGNADAAGWLVNFHNPEQIAGARVRVACDKGPIMHAFVASLDHVTLTPCPFEERDNAVEAVLPKAVIGTVLLLERSKPCLLRAWQPISVAGARNAIELRFRPLRTDLPTTAVARVAAPEGWRAEPVTFPTDAARDVALPVTIPAAAERGGHRVTVHVQMGDTRWQRPLGLLVEDRFAMGLRRDGRNVVAHVTNRADSPASGRVHLVLADTTKTSSADVPASEGTDVVFGDVLPAKVAKSIPVRATFKAQGERAEAAITVEPPDLAAVKWQKAVYERSARQWLAEDRKTLVIEANDARSRVAWRWRTEGLAVGTKWTFTAEFRTENVASTSVGARVRIIRFDRRHRNRGAAPTIMTEPVVGTQDWTPVCIEFTVPPHCSVVQIELFLAHATGKAMWRHMRLE